jgi:hypothetical protein
MFTVYSAEFVVHTKGKGTYEVTDKVAELVRASQVQTVTACLFLKTPTRLRVVTSRNFSNSWFPKAKDTFLTRWRVRTICLAIFVWQSRGPRNQSRSRLANCGSALAGPVFVRTSRGGCRAIDGCLGDRNNEMKLTPSRWPCSFDCPV